MKPKLASAYYLFGAISSSDLTKLASDWISQGIYTDSILNLSLEPSYGYSSADSIFEQVLSDLEIQDLTKKEAAWMLSKDTIDKMVKGDLNLTEGVNFLHNRIYDEIRDEDLNEKYIGSFLGLENIFSLMHEVWDRNEELSILYYGKPKNEIEQKFIDDLRRECQKWLEKYGESVII